MPETSPKTMTGWRNKLPLLVTATMILAFGSTTVLAETCRGKWGGGASTSVTFKAGNSVRYCWKTKCWNSTYIGDKNSKLSFKFGKARAKIIMWKTPAGYKVNWQSGKGRGNARTKLSCS